MEIEKIKITDIKPAEYNPRNISSEELKKLENSISTFGLVDPIIINLKNNKIIGGHQRYEVLINQYMLDNNFYAELNLIRMGDIGWIFTETDLKVEDEDHEKALNLALNKISGEWDFEKLGEILDELTVNDFNIELTGFDEIELKELDLNQEEYTPVEDNYEEPSEIEVTVKTGDMYCLGNHTLLCGDATKIEDIITLTGGGQIIDSVITDPPYNLAYGNKNALLNELDGGNRITQDIINDNIEEFNQFLQDILTNIITTLKEYNTLYIFMSGKELHNLRLALDNAKCVWGDYLVWVKNNHVLGRKDYKSKHEFCLYGWYNKHKFYGDFSTTILEYPKPLKNDLHPTMKPIPLISKLITDGTPINGNVLDIFGGSGTSLIACEQTNRNCYMIEKDPKYCQIIINRWEEYTGQKAHKI